MRPTYSPSHRSIPTRLVDGLRQLDARLAWLPMMLVRGYRLLLSPSLGSSCRFTPTCSAYALEALQTHGAAEGSYLATRRVLRCHPWCAGGHDPVPPSQQAPLPIPPKVDLKS